MRTGTKMGRTLKNAYFPPNRRLAQFRLSGVEKNKKSHNAALV